MNRFSASPINLAALRRAAPVFALCLTLLPSHTAFADRVVLRNGQAVDGVIRDENPFQINIEVRGIVTSIPRERVRQIQRNTPEENTRMLLDSADDAINKNDISSARTLVQQAKTLNSQDPALNERLAQLDRDVTKMEQSGGSPEERRRRADTLIHRATEAYDRIRNEEGHEFLIQALKSYPESPEGQALINSRLARGAATEPMLAARYFAEVLHPNNMAPSIALIQRLPSVYSELADRLDTTTDLTMANNYITWIQALHQAFADNSSWLGAATEQQREVIERPLSELLGDLIANNLEREDYDFALQKLQAWAKPENSAEEAMLLARANVGVGNHAEAERILETAQSQFPTVSDLTLQYNAITLMIKGFQALDSGSEDLGVETLEQVYNGSEDLLPEIKRAIGRRLARVFASDIDEPSPVEVPWRQADSAALVMRYARDNDLRRDAARILASTIHSAPWNLNLIMRVNGIDLPLNDELLRTAADALSGPLGVRHHSGSTFRADIIMNLALPQAEADRLASTLGSNMGGYLRPPIAVPRLEFNVIASQPTLGEMLNEKWNVSTLPPTVVQRRQALFAPVATPAPFGFGALAPVATPAPEGAMPLPEAPAATPIPTPAPTPAPEPTPDPVLALMPTTGTTIAGGLLGATSPTLTAELPSTATATLSFGGQAPPPASGPGMINIGSGNDITLFLRNDLADFLSPNVLLVTSHLRIPLIDLLLRNEAILQ